MELLFPILQMASDAVAFHPALLPGGEITVLDGQLLKRRRAAGQISFVNVRKLGEEHAVRPAINDDMVEREYQQVILRSKTDEGSAEQGCTFDIKRLLAILYCEADCFLFSLCGGKMANIRNGNGNGELGSDRLNRFAFHFGNTESQSVVTPHNFIDRSLQ